MKKNNNSTKIFLAFILLYQALFVNACSIFNFPNTNTNLKPFSKKAVPDPVLCNASENLGVSVSTSKLHTKESVTITTNIPVKIQKTLDVFNFYWSRDGWTQIPKVVISQIGNKQKFEKEITVGCNSFEWDGNDNNGVRFNEGQYTVSISLGMDFPNFSWFYRYLEPMQIFLCDGVPCSGNLNYYHPASPSYSDSAKLTTVFTEEEFSKQIESTNIEVLNVETDPTPLDPATTKFFEVEDFQKLSDYANQLNIDDSQANELYNQAVLLDKYEKEKSSLLARGKVDTTKLDAINRKIQSANDSITSLQGSVMVQLSDLYNKAYNLANHVNSITETQYIVNENNVNNIWAYMDTFYALDQSIESLLSANTISFYEPDKESLNKTNVAFKWQVKNERVEILDPRDIFDASGKISYEIELAKQLTGDILADKFDPKYKMSAISELKTAITQIKNHNQYLKSSSKDFYLKYQERFKKLNEIYTTIVSDSILNLSLVIENRDLYSDKTYRLKNETLNKIVDKSKKIASDVSSAVKTEVDRRIIVARSFKGSQIPEKEITTAIMLGIDSTSWKLLKDYNQKTVDDLVNSVEALVDMSLKLIPGNETGKINFNDIAKDPIGIFSERTSKQVELALGKKVTLPELVDYLFEVADYVKGLKTLYDKYLLATAPKKVNGNPCYPDGTLAPMPNTNNVENTDRVDCVRDLAKFSVSQRLNKNLKEYYEGEKNNADATKRRPANQIFTESELKKLRDALKDGDKKFREVLRSVVTDQKSNYSNDYIEAPDENDPNKEWKDKIYTEYIEIYKRVVDKNIYDGIPINKIEIKTTQPEETFYIYTPAFKVHNFSSANTSSLPPYGGRGIVGELLITTTIDLEGNSTLTGKGTNFGSGDFRLASLQLKENLNTNANYSKIDEYVEPAFTWHHDEGLDQMILVPRFLHYKMRHWGGASLLEKSGSSLRKEWKKSLKYLDIQ